MEDDSGALAAVETKPATGHTPGNRPFGHEQSGLAYPAAVCRRHPGPRAGAGGRLAEGPVDRLQESLNRKGLLDEINRAEPGGGDGQLDAAVPRNNDDGHVRTRPPYPRQKLNPVHVGHPHIDQYEVGRFDRQPSLGLLPAGGSTDVEAFVAQHPADGLAHGGIVVDYQDLLHRLHRIAQAGAACASSPSSLATGNSMTNRVPVGLLS